MARPKKQEHEKRTQQLKADVTLAEKEQIRERVAASGLSEAEFIRQAVFDAEVTPPKGRVDAALISELSRIGSNVNQIARNLNSGRKLTLNPEVVMAELRGTLEKVASAYGA